MFIVNIALLKPTNNINNLVIIYKIDLFRIASNRTYIISLSYCYNSYYNNKYVVTILFTL